MRTRLFLSPSNNTLVGNYSGDCEHIHVVADSATGAFEILLPDVSMPEHREYIIYNYPSSGAGNDITVKPVTGQFLINRDTSHVLKPFDTVSFVADLKNRWLLTDVNTGGSVGPEGQPGPAGADGADGAPGIPTTVLDTSTVDLTLTGSQLSAETIGLTGTITF
jgi:hypothetical protein